MALHVTGRLQAVDQRLARAIEAVEAPPWLDDPRPITAYLRGESSAGVLWLYRAGQDGRDVLIEKGPTGILRKAPGVRAA